MWITELSNPANTRFRDDRSAPGPVHPRARRRAALLTIRERMVNVRFESSCAAIPRQSRYHEPLPGVSDDIADVQA